MPADDTQLQQAIDLLTSWKGATGAGTVCGPGTVIAVGPVQEMGIEVSGTQAVRFMQDSGVLREFTFLGSELKQGGRYKLTVRPHPPTSQYDELIGVLQVP